MKLPYIQQRGTQQWCSGTIKTLSRIGGPAWIFVDGYQEWYKNGKWHRDDGPAILDIDGRKEYWQDDKYSKKDNV